MSLFTNDSRRFALEMALDTFRVDQANIRHDALVEIAESYLAFLEPQAPQAEKVAAPPKVGRPKKAAPAPSAAEPAPTAEPSTPPPSAAASPTEVLKPPTTEEVRAVLVAVQTKFDRKRAEALLNKWSNNGGVISKVPEGDRAKLIAEGQGLVA